MENGSAIIKTVKSFVIKLIDNSKISLAKKMLCWKKGSYTKKTTNNNSSNNSVNSNSNVQLISFKRLQSIKRKNNNNKSPITIRFKSNLR